MIRRDRHRPLESSGRSAAAGAPANPLVLAIVLFGSTISALAFVTVTPGLPRIAAHFAGQGDSTLRAQLVLTMAPVGMAFGGMAAGWVTSRLGLRGALFAALFGCGIFGMAPLLLDSLWAIFAVRFLIGWSAVTVDICLTTILSARYEGESRARLIGFKQAIGSCFTVGGTLASGALIQAFDWRAPFFLFAIAFLYLVIAASAFRVPFAHEGKITTPSLATVAGLWPLYLMVIVLAIAHSMPHFELPFLLTVDGMTNAEHVSWFPATAAFVSILSASTFGWIHARLGRWTLVAALSLMGLGLAGIGLVPTFALIFAAVVVEGFGGGLMLPFLSNEVLEKAPLEQRSQAFGLLLSLMFIGQFFNPIVNAPLRDGLGIHNAFVTVGAALLAISAALAIARRRPVAVRPADL